MSTLVRRARGAGGFQRGPSSPIGGRILADSERVDKTHLGIGLGLYGEREYGIEELNAIDLL